MNQHESESALARVLAALQNAQAPPGMEDRILKAIAESKPAPSSTKSLAPTRMSWFAGIVRPRLAYSLAAAAALVLGVWLAHRGPASGQRSAETYSRTPGSPLPSLPPHFTSIGTAAIPRPVAEGPIHGVHPRRADLQPAPPSSVQPNPRPNAAPDSFPAPPAPLTAQERLLLRLVHQDDPQELTTLDPAIRASLDAQDASDFYQFFKPLTSVTPADSETPDNPTTPASPATPATPTNPGDHNEPVQP